ncbi:MAG: cytochrome oxidase putative small subunit CydP [Stellaceae bacterium]
MLMMASRLQRDISTVLVLKLVLLGALYLAFFRGDQRPAIDAERAARHLLSVEAPR